MIEYKYRVLNPNMNEPQNEWVIVKVDTKTNKIVK